jgi:hypothetical protein
MVGELTGKVVDVLRVLASTKTYRASVADTTRRLVLKGMAVEAAEYAQAYASGRPVELTTELLDLVAQAMNAEFRALGSAEPDVVLHMVLSRMWPDVVQACDKLDVRKPLDAKKHRKILAGAPLTRMGRPPTAKEIREQALADVVAGRVEPPKLVPPRTVQEAEQQARLNIAADRVAMNQGVSAETLLAGTAGGRMAGMKAPEESAAALGWTPDAEVTGGRTGNPRPTEEAEPLSVGEMLAQIRKDRR